MEIERKFILSAFPDMEPIGESVIYQSYLSVTGDIECRIRKRITDGIATYKMCFKTNGDIIREEVESEISESFYTELMTLIDNKSIKKLYRTYLIDDYKLECSIVDEGTSHSFIYAEIEFPTVEAAQAYDASWIPNLLKEVTYNEEYKMKNYWKRYYQ